MMIDDDDDDDDIYYCCYCNNITIASANPQHYQYTQRIKLKHVGITVINSFKICTNLQL